MDLHESPRPLSVFASSATSSCIFRQDHYPLFSLSLPFRRPTDDHLHIHAIIDFAVFISFKVERRFFLLRARGTSRKINDFRWLRNFARLSGGGGKKGEKFDFRRASLGVTRHNQKLIIDLMLCVRKKNQFDFLAKISTEFFIISSIFPSVQSAAA